MNGCVDVGPAEPSPGGLEDPCAALQSKLGGTVRRAVDDEHLAYRPGSAQSFLAPSYEVGDGEFLVRRRDEDGDLGRFGVVGRQQEMAVRIAS